MLNKLFTSLEPSLLFVVLVLVNNLFTPMMLRLTSTHTKSARAEAKCACLLTNNHLLQQCSVTVFDIFLHKVIDLYGNDWSYQ